MSFAIYPGTFDPVTNGHLDVLERASRIFDHVLVAISVDNSGKKNAFDCETRVAISKFLIDVSLIFLVVS